ncbi:MULTISPECIES: protein translocase subunit SecD [Halomonadaceae]|jgi:preprotein translocase subunit SecD|uniref:Protein translocase subunit SecD n=1 Tax=Vreelandella piezotolerans TaxID=2609667 RepID=A0ABQ6X4Z4_9GAMM|nr:MULTISPECIES: protein translocase subunit SecD [Halomonas]KAE8437101.1 protein translocase subunit SecD [Halomonas piezotolerans]MCG7575758.1 protein translocase subunit SecD [Halomonas sp. MMH1-48]MCG7589724.1 protein translocase subunit SecD [Halomonas sp. McD50-5]MCG7602820.1 protein translocase subunit SecD [Halomonas sp. MM17-34]MCG7612141.1 protein translocase subunit SecD [Halomonas sp. MM17-29]
MLNRYPLWKYLLILVVLVVGLIYSLPNLFPADPAIQVSDAQGNALDERQITRVEEALSESDIAVKAVEETNGQWLIRLQSDDDQLDARDIAADVLGPNATVALNLADATPEWLQAFAASPMTLGLDLRGGVHFLLEVDMEAALTQRLEVNASAMRELLRSERIRYRNTTIDDRSLSIDFASSEDRDAARRLISRDFPNFEYTNEGDGRASSLVMTLSDMTVNEIQDYAINQNLTTLRNRVNELGVAEPMVQRQGPSQIVVELPGVQDTVAAKRIVGATANLEFRLEARNDTPDAETERFEFRNDPSRSAELMRDVIITGDSVSSASNSFDENGRPQVNINLDGTGGTLMNRATRTNIGRNMAVLFIEHKSEDRIEVDPETGEETIVREPYTERGLISLATIQSALGNSFRITGLDSPTEAAELALLLRSGSLAAPIYFVQERTIGPSLGAENIERGLLSVQIGLLLVVLFMLVRYKVFGVFANVALALNLTLLVAVMSMLGATLTLPGIAGIVLTLGMAVDANVLIFERIREELRNGMSIQQAIYAGYERAFTSIVDANITTLLVAVILFSIGTGPVKGFAVTLSIGILTSMFTALLVTRAMVNLTYGGKPVKKLWI